MTDALGAPLLRVKVGIFETPRKRSISLRAYTLWYPDRGHWPGCCEHTVSVERQRDAKAAALAEHRARCMRR